MAAVLAGSLSLLADAGHNLSDVVALGVAAGAVMLARRPATPNRSFGFKRAEILAALFNAVSLIVIAVIVFVGAALRFADTPDVPGGWLIVVATVGLLVNAIGAAAVFRRGGRTSTSVPRTSTSSATRSARSQSSSPASSSSPRAGAMRTRSWAS